jgi:hypothetical protein
LPRVRGRQACEIVTLERQHSHRGRGGDDDAGAAWAVVSAEMTAIILMVRMVTPVNSCGCPLLRSNTAFVLSPALRHYLRICQQIVVLSGTGSIGHRE